MDTLSKSNLFELISGIEDPRSRQGRMHSLPFILITAIMAIMNGANSFYAISDFLTINKKDLFKLFKMKGKQKRLPSRMTISRLLWSLDFDKLKSIFYNWSSSKIKIQKGDVISIDGKSIKGTVTNPNNSFQNFTSLVSLYVQKKGQVLSLEKLEAKKENEIPVVQKLLEMLDLEGITFTLDALHCQKKTTAKIIETKNNYIVQVKGNQGKLYNNLKKTPNLSYQ